MPAALLAGVPASDRTNEQQAIALLAVAVDYHSREEKSFWREHCTRLGAAPDAWARDGEVLVVRSFERDPWDFKRALKHGAALMELVPGDGEKIYDQALEFMSGSIESGRGTVEVEVVRHDEDVLQIKGEKWPVEEPETGLIPVAVIPDNPPHTTALLQAIATIGTSVLAGQPEWPRGAVFDILSRREPRLEPGAELTRTDDCIADVECSVRTLDSSYLAVQGPPGSGKTYLAARVIKSIVESGWREGLRGYRGTDSRGRSTPGCRRVPARPQRDQPSAGHRTDSRYRKASGHGCPGSGLTGGGGQARSEYVQSRHGSTDGYCDGSVGQSEGRFTVLELSENEASLEDAFVEVTGGSVEDRTDDSSGMGSEKGKE